MESVNLEMEDIFEEEAIDEDFPSVGPLPDLPDREEGTGEGEQDDENAAVMSKLKDLSKGAAKKVVRRPLPKLDSQRLSGERGIPILPKVFENVKLKGKGNEAQDLRIIMRYLEHWAHRLFPMMPFDEVLERIEKLGTKKEVQTCIKKMRLDMPLLNDEYVQDLSDAEADDKDKNSTEKNGDDGVELDAWDEIIQEHEEDQRVTRTSNSDELTSHKVSSLLSTSQQSTPVSQLKSQLSKPLMDLNSSSQPYTASPIPGSRAGSGGLTIEQRERIERNKQLALEKKMGKQGFKTPAVPSSPFRTPQSSPIVSRLSPGKPSAAASHCKSPCKKSLSPSFNSKSTTFLSLVKGNEHNSGMDVNKLSYDSTADLESQHTDRDKPSNGDTHYTQDSDDFMSEVIPFIDQRIMKGPSQNSDYALIDVIPNQDLKRNIDKSADQSLDLAKKQKLNNGNT